MNESIPSSIEAEKALLSCFFISPLEIGAMCAETLDHRYFIHPPHQTLFSVMLSMWKEQEPIDLVTVGTKLMNQGRIAEAGGLGYVSEVMTHSPTLAHAGEYQDILIQKFTLREIIRIASTGSTKAMTEPEDVQAILHEMEQGLASILSRKKEEKTNKDLAMEIIQELEDKFENRQNPKDVLKTGFTELDHAMGGGLRSDDYVLLTGPTKAGKSILAQNIQENVWGAFRRPTAAFSLEMGRKSYVYRVLASTGRISATRMRSGWLNNGDMGKLAASVSSFAESQIHIFEDCFSLLQIISRARQMKQRHPDLGLIVVDYVQLIDCPRHKGDTREAQVAEISTTLRRLNLQLGVPVVVVAQENKAGDARESARLEQDCTIRVKIEHIMNGTQIDNTQRNIAIPLSRNGPCCEFKLTFQGEYLRFENQADQQQ